MSETAYGPLSPEFEDLLAFRLAKKVLITMAAILTPVVLLLGWLGYDRYADFKTAYEKNTELLTQTTRETRARADTLRMLTAELRLIVNEQTHKLADFDNEADASRLQLQGFYSRVAEQAADDRVKLHDAISHTTALAADVGSAAARAEAAAGVAQRAGPELERLARSYDATNQAAQQALTMAEEAAVQTVGARQRRHLFGTPFDVYFSGVSGNYLRDFMIAHENGATLKSVPRQPSTEVLQIDAGGETYHIAIVNTIDVPGSLLRLNGASRADAATFRVSRVRAAATPRLTSNPAQPD